MKAVSIIKYVFSLIGAGMLVGAYFLYQNTQTFLTDAVVSEGTVVDLIMSRSSDSTTYRPSVEFVTQQGELIAFESSTGSNPPSYSRGEKVEVLYSPEQPNEARINSYFSLWGGATIVGGIGAVFFLIGFGIIFAGMSNAKKIAYLKKRGTRVHAKFQRVELNQSYSVNGRHPFQIVTQWMNPATNKLHIFRSENIWFDPTDHIKGDEIAVLIERNKPEKYYVDTSFLPDVA